MFTCNSTVFLIFLINAILRGAGDALLAMRTLWLANVLNIALGPCFIFGWGPFPDLGVTGAAVATNIGRGVGVLYQMWHLAAPRGRIQVRLRHFTPALDALREVVTKAGAGVVQLLISNISWVGLFKLLAMYGSAALAGYTIAIRMVIFVLLPAWGVANAAAALVGQNLGAGRPDRAEAAVKIATRFNMIYLGVAGAVLVIFAYPLVRVFTSDPEVLQHGSRALWIVSVASPLYAAGMCLSAAFNGSGDTWTPARLNFFCLWVGQLPLAWALAKLFGLGPLGIFIAVPVSYSMLALLSALLFTQGRWKYRSAY